MADFERTLSNPHPPIGAYSHLARVKGNELLFIAGQVSVGEGGAIVGEGDVAAQTRQVYANLAKVLESAGAGFSNVVEFTTYLVGRDSVQPFMAARADIFPSLYPNGDYPPNTLLVIEGLVREEFLVEIKAVAALP